MTLRFPAAVLLVTCPAMLSAQAPAPAPAPIVANEPVAPSPPPPIEFRVPPRLGIMGEMRLSLNDVILGVLANDPNLQVSRIALEEAGLDIQGAKGYFDPRLTGPAYHLKSVSPIASLIGGSSTGKLTQREWYADPQLTGSSPWLGSTYKLDFASARQSSDSTFITLNPQFPTSVTLTLTQPLWSGLRFDANRHRVAVARKNQSISFEQLRQQVIASVTQAIQAYWELEFATNNLTVQLQAVQLAEQQDASNRRQVQQGLLSSVDVIQTQTQIATFEQNVFTAQQALTRAEDAIKVLILSNRGDPAWSMALIPVTPIEASVKVPNLADAIQTALKMRPELSQNQLSIEVNQLDARLSQDLAKPQINAVGTFGLAGLAGTPVPIGPSPFPGFGFPTGTLPPLFVGGYPRSLSNIGTGEFPTVQVGVQFSIPIRNRTAEAQVAISAAEGRRLRALQRQTEMAIQSDVRNSLQNLDSARLRLDAAVLARRSAEDQYASEQRQFQAGTSTVFLVLQRQTELISARTSEVRARADLAEAAADVDRATSQTIAAHNIDIGKP